MIVFECIVVKEGYSYELVDLSRRSSSGDGVVELFYSVVVEGDDGDGIAATVDVIVE